MFFGKDPRDLKFNRRTKGTFFVRQVSLTTFMFLMLLEMNGPVLPILLNMIVWLIICLFAVSKFIRIGIADKNDNPPYFDKNLYEAEVDENEDIQHTVLTVTANDKDECKYTLEIKTVWFWLDKEWPDEISLAWKLEISSILISWRYDQQYQGIEQGLKLCHISQVFSGRKS